MTAGSRAGRLGAGLRDHGPALAWGGFYAAVLAAWAGVFLMARAQPGSGAPEGFWDSLCIAAAEADPLALLAMWALMASAMMLPTFVPAMRVFGELSGTGASDGRTMLALAGGFLAVWLAASAVGAAAQGMLSGAALLAPDGSSRSVWLTAGLLALAGAYQFSPLKEGCLSRCRHPLMFFMQHWRPGVAPAFVMGARLGLACLGCCWALMALGFVGGVMNLAWMGAATLFMTLEKLPSVGRILTRPAGAALLAVGALTALRAITTG